MLPFHLAQRSVVMMKELETLLKMFAREPVSKSPKPRVQKRANAVSDFRAVEIAPRVLCCEAAKRAASNRYLLRKAPRVPLVGCTMPMNCSCIFLKKADRRDGDRRLLGAGTSRWFAGVESRKIEGRRVAER
jgi:hypothetical protein